MNDKIEETVSDRRAPGLNKHFAGKIFHNRD